MLNLTTTGPQNVVSKNIVESDLPRAGQNLLQFWQSCNLAHNHPNRSDFTPLDLKEWLGNIDIYDVLEDGNDFQVRLTGSFITEITQENWTGRTASDIDAKFGCNLLAELKVCVENKQPIIDIVKIYQKPHLKMYRILMPIYSNQDDGTISQIFLAFFEAEH